MLEHQIESIQVLDHRHDEPTERDGEHRELDTVIVLEPVADDDTFPLIGGESKHREKLGLGADLETKAEFITDSSDIHDHASRPVHRVAGWMPTYGLWQL